MSSGRFSLLAMMIGIPALLRMADLGWNFAPIGAIALFAGATFRSRLLAFAVPICAMFASDLLLGWHRHDFTFYTFHALLPVIYGCYALSVCLGFGIRWKWNQLDALEGGGSSGGFEQKNEQKHESRSLFSRRILPVFIAVLYWLRVTSCSLFSRRMLPVAYGALTGSILFFLITNFGDWLLYYERSWNGLTDCYIQALPFFRNTLASDAFGTAVLFGGYEVVCRRAALADPTGLLHAR